LFSYEPKLNGANHSSTRLVTKQFMNPNRKYLDKQRNKTFIEPKEDYTSENIHERQVFHN